MFQPKLSGSQSEGEVNQPIIKEEEYETKPNINAAVEPRVRASNQRRPKKPYHRHTHHQIKEMESYFIECPYPDEEQRKELALELGLEPLQVKFWFQNKRTQKKAQHEHRENLQLMSENKKLLAEHLSLKEAMRNSTCSKCGGPAFVPGGMSCEAQRLRMENARLREEIGMISELAENFTGKPIPAGAPSPPVNEEEPAAVEVVATPTMWNDN